MFEPKYKPIPKCHTIGCENPLFDIPSWHYDGRRKYCKQCAYERKLQSNAFHTWKQRHYEKEVKPYKKEQMDLLKEENALLKEEVQLLKQELINIRLSLRG